MSDEEVLSVLHLLGKHSAKYSVKFISSFRETHYTSCPHIIIKKICFYFELVTIMLTDTDRVLYKILIPTSK